MKWYTWALIGIIVEGGIGFAYHVNNMKKNCICNK